MALPTRPSSIPQQQLPHGVGRSFEHAPFQLMQPDGSFYFSGANVRVYFDDILVEEVDSVGGQLAQNIKPIYGYHSFGPDAWQYGTHVVQGYLQMPFTRSAYFPTILSAVEHRRRKRLQAFSGPETPEQRAAAKRDPRYNQKVIPSSAAGIGVTLEEAIKSIDAALDWREVADEYDARRFGYAAPNEDEQLAKLAIPGLFPRLPQQNSFIYAPPNTHLAEEGFTLSIVYGPIEDTFSSRVQYNTKTGRYEVDPSGGFVGSIQQLHGVRVVAGPNQQITVDEPKVITSLYTFVAEDMT